MKAIVTYFTPDIQFALEAVLVTSPDELARIVYNVSRNECRIFYKGESKQINYIGIDIQEGHDLPPKGKQTPP